MKKTTIRTVTILLGISVIWLGGFYYFMSRDTRTWQKSVLQPTIQKIYHDTDLNVIAIKYDNSKNERSDDFEGIEQVEDQVIVPRIQLQQLYDKDDPVKYGKNRMKTEHFYLDVYPLENGKPKKSKSIDVKKIIEEAMPEYSPIAVGRVFLAGQRKIAIIKVYNRTTGKEYEAVTLDLESEKLLQDDEWQWDEDKSADQSLVRATNFAELIDEYGVDLIGYSTIGKVNIYDYFYDTKGKKVKRKAGWEELPILQEYPELSGFFDVEKGKTASCLFIDEKVTGEQLVTWFYPANKNVFSSLILNRWESIDEQEQKISSLKKFNQYYKYSPDNYEETKAKEREKEELRKQNQQEQTETTEE